jgi:hypothetical protein
MAKNFSILHATFFDITAIFPQIDISVCIDLNVFPIAGQQQIQDMIAIKLSNPAPIAAAIRATLQFLVIIRINPVYERADSYLTSHNLFIDLISSTINSNISDIFICGGISAD